MKRKIGKFIYLLSAIVLLAGTALWAAGGFHTGWTQTQIATQAIDPITEIEYTTYEEGFIAGIEIFLAAIGTAGALAVLGIFLSRTLSNNNHNS